MKFKREAGVRPVVDKSKTDSEESFDHCKNHCLLPVDVRVVVVPVVVIAVIPVVVTDCVARFRTVSISDLISTEMIHEIICTEPLLVAGKMGEPVSIFEGFL